MASKYRHAEPIEHDEWSCQRCRKVRAVTVRGLNMEPNAKCPKCGGALVRRPVRR